MGVGLTTPRWRALAASAPGTSHLANGTGCQDAHEVRLLAGGSLVIAVADGAGSAPRAADGAARAVAAAADAVEAHADAAVDLRQLVAGALVAARTALETDTAPLHDLATTLLVVVARSDGVASAQIGDGAVVVSAGASLRTIGGAPPGEYLNETTFLTSSRWSDDAQIEVVTAESVDSIAVLSDGLQLLALDLAGSTPHPPFFAPLFHFAHDESASDAELAAFLASERVCERTDDDKTLVLAVRTG